MTRERAIAFHGNHNNASCGQCVYKMILSHFYPDDDWPFSKMDEICGAITGKYTWMYKPVIELHKMGLEVIVLTKFDTAEFIASPETYLTKEYGIDGCRDNIKNSDMPSLLKQAAEYYDLLEAGRIKEVETYYNVDDIKHFLDQGYLLNIWVNSRKLNKIEGYVGHFILIHDYTNDAFIAHDPGGNYEDGSAKNQIENRLISYEELIFAASPKITGQTSELIAIKKRTV